MDLKINKELKRLIPPLSEDEYNILEKSIIEEGCRDRLITWDDTIVDGHNRYEICKKNGITFNVEDRDFENIEAVKIWMIDNQKGRRNLTDGWKWELAQTKKEILAEKAKENKLGRGKVLSNVDKTNTQQEIAKDLGWSTGKVAMADKVWKEGKPEVKDKIKAGETSINQAYQEIKRESKKKERQDSIKKQRNELKDIPLPKRKYSLIYIDPPWKYDFSETDNRKIENHYPTMTMKELYDLNLPSNDNCILYLWVTAPKLLEAVQLMNEWGFEYKTCAVWDKKKIGMGYWFRGQHELLFVATKGTVSPPEPENRVSSVISEKRNEHSAKPYCVYDIIENAFPNHSKVEIFARNKRNGWDSWGNQV